MRHTCRTNASEVVGMGFSEAFVRQVWRMVQRNQYKRCPPTIAKVSGRTLDWEFRMPRDWGT